jgi:hypothetical protein
MSAMGRQRNLAALSLAARRSAAGRSRRADDGVLTEMARSLLRDVRDSHAPDGRYGQAQRRPSASLAAAGGRPGS